MSSPLQLYKQRIQARNDSLKALEQQANMDSIRTIQPDTNKIAGDTLKHINTAVHLDQIQAARADRPLPSHIFVGDKGKSELVDGIYNSLNQLINIEADTNVLSELQEYQRLLNEIEEIHKPFGGIKRPDSEMAKNGDFFSRKKRKFSRLDF